MKHARELKVGILALVCAGILYFGFNFLKGINIFSPTRCYMGQFEKVAGLTEQAPVYIRGYKVGIVESILYDFTRDTSFVVAVSIDKAINLPKGTQMALVSDGLLGGMAIELCIPKQADTAVGAPYHRGDTLPTLVVPGLLDGLQTGLLAHLDSVLQEANTLVASLNDEMEAGSLHATLQNIERITADLAHSSRDIRAFTGRQLPPIVAKADSAMGDLQAVAAAVRAADLENTLRKLDTAIGQVNTVLQSDSGTLGLLLNDKTLYDNLNAALRDLDGAVLNVDTVVMSVKAHPCIRKRIPRQKP